MKLDTAKLYVDWVNLKFGFIQYTCWANEVPMPVGMAWVIRGGVQGGLTQSQIMHMFTVPFARRNGVAKALLKSMLQHAELLTTAEGSKDGGRKLIESFGFRYDRQRGDWWYRTKKPEQLSKL